MTRADAHAVAAVALAVSALAPPGGPALAADGASGPFATPFAFHNARLGDRLETWRAGGPPGPVSPNAVVACRPAAAGTECLYVDRVGGRALPQSLPLFGRRRATDVRYVFIQDRLAQIRLRTSVDAFSEVIAQLKRAYGADPQITRDQVRLSSGGELPRVRASWRVEGHPAVLVIDPSEDPTRLEVVIGAPG